MHKHSHLGYSPAIMLAITLAKVSTSSLNASGGLGPGVVITVDVGSGLVVTAGLGLVLVIYTGFGCGNISRLWLWVWMLYVPVLLPIT